MAYSNQRNENNDYSFRGDRYFLSNMCELKYQTISYNGLNFKSVEAAFQAQKTTNPGQRVAFQNLKATDARKLGQQVPLRSDWDVVKDDIMRDLIDLKFSIPYFRKQLSQIHDPKIVEVVPDGGDTEWGAVRIRDAQGEPLHDVNGTLLTRGKNKLGEILTQKRNEILLENGIEPPEDPNKRLTVAITGHRPNKLWGYNTDETHYDTVSSALQNFIQEHGVTTLIDGMAQGFDQLAARAAIKSGVRTIAAIPFVGQESQWPQASQNAYHDLLKQHSSVHVVCPGEYAASKMQVRNQWMVDNADIVVALWDGTKGGTKNAVDYALKTGKPIYVLNPNDVQPGTTPKFELIESQQPQQQQQIDTPTDSVQATPDQTNMALIDDIDTLLAQGPQMRLDF